MKALMTAAALALCLPLFGQVDSTADNEHLLQIGYAPGNGMVAKVERMDTTNTDDPDTVRIEMRHKTYTIITTRNVVNDSVEDAAERERELRRKRRNLFTYWSGLDLGLNNYLGPDGSMELDTASDFMELDTWASRFFAINFMEQKIEFGSHHVGLLTGLGVEFTSYKLANNVVLDYNEDSTYAVEVETPSFSKNKLRQIGLRMPLMLEFNTGRAEVTRSSGTHNGDAWVEEEMTRKNNFHIAVGVIGSLYFDTMYKQKYHQDGEKQKDRRGGTFNLLPYRAAASVRIGYGGLNLFAEYGLTTLFEDGKGPELTPLNVGLTIIGFN